jgi:hypothetical protein
MPYALGIDLGSGRTTAAISRNDRERWLEPEVVPLDGDPAGVASVLHVTPHDAVEVGTSALHALPARAGWITRGVVDRIGDEIPVTLGGQPYPAEVLTAALVGWVVDYVEALERVPATQLVVTHPPAWGIHRRALLLSALREVNLPDPTLLPRPVAAAEAHAAAQRVEIGEQIAVHSLGSTRFECAVLRRGSFGFELRSHADGVEPVAGDLFDDLLADHVLASLSTPPDAVGLAKLRAACTEAKEHLSTEAAVSVAGVRITRAEFEELVRPAVESTVESLRRTIQAEDQPVTTVVLVGGCGRIPLVTELVTAGTRVRVAAAPDPETSIARGAALAAARVAKPTVRAAALAMTPEPLTRSTVTHTDLMRFDELPEEDLTELGPKPPRPPVEIAPLEPPKRRLLGLRGPKQPDNQPPEDDEFADLDLDPRRKRPAIRAADPKRDVIDEDIVEIEEEPYEDSPFDDEPSHDGEPAQSPRRRHPFLPADARRHPSDDVHPDDIPEPPRRREPSSAFADPDPAPPRSARRRDPPTRDDWPPDPDLPSQAPVDYPPHARSADPGSSNHGTPHARYTEANFPTHDPDLRTTHPHDPTDDSPTRSHHATDTDSSPVQPRHPEATPAYQPIHPRHPTEDPPRHRSTTPDTAHPHHPHHSDNADVVRPRRPADPASQPPRHGRDEQPDQPRATDSDPEPPSRHAAPEPRRHRYRAPAPRHADHDGGRG